MIYSCFDPDAGLYRYFEDGTRRPINADLPVPKLPSKAGKIGFAAIEAARPLPSAAKPAGSGWHARGIIVRCPKGPLSGLGELGTTGTTVLAFGVAAVALWLLTSPSWS